MNENYFRRVRNETPTQLFCDGPHMPWLTRAVEWGAVGCTSNPPRVARAVRLDAEYWDPEIDRILAENPGLPDEDLADIVTQLVVRRAGSVLRPVFEETGGERGYQAIQGNPRAYTDIEVLTSSARRYAKIAPNVAVKIPAHKEGLVAMEELAADGINIVPTVGYSVSQCVAAAEAYQRGSERAKKSGKCFVTMVTGRLDSHLKEQIEKEGIDLPEGWVDQAGLAVTKKIYRLFRERSLPYLIIAAGARGPRHFTELVGGDLFVTLSAPVQEEIVALDPPVISRIDDFPPEEVIQELRQKFPDFRRAYDEDGLEASEMRAFGPAVKIEEYFLEGFDNLIQSIRARKK